VTGIEYWNGYHAGREEMKREIEKAKCKKGHDLKKIDGTKVAIYYEKGGREKAYFSGNLFVCKRKGCGFELYEGPRNPYKIEFSDLVKNHRKTHRRKKKIN